MEPVVIRRESEHLLVIIAPARTARLIVGEVLLVGGLALLASLFLGFIVIAAISGGSSAGELAVAGLPAAACAIALTLAIRRIIPVARFAQEPATIQISQAALTIHVPTLGKRGRRQWATGLIADVSIRHAGLFPGVMRFIRIRLSLTDDQADVILIPSPGGESLALIEDNLRDALGLPAIT